MSPHPVYDLIGLGFGPANVAIGGALIEKFKLAPPSDATTAGNNTKSALFIEKHSKFQWHPGMLLPDARMQISFLKDLATLRNPQSPITFLSYLHDQNRLVAFINRGGTVPTRKEYADYLSWCAQYVQDRGAQVAFGQEVVSIAKGPDNTIEVKSKDLSSGEFTVRYARDLIIAPGGAGYIPETFSLISDHPAVIHSSCYAFSIADALKAANTNRPLRVAVVGGGQSAAEVSMNLRERLSAMPHSGDHPHEVDVLISKGALKPSDDSSFSNEIFDPATTETWFNLPSHAIRASQLKEYRDTNYGVVNPRTIEALYEIVYDQKLDDSIAHRTSSSIPLHQPRINIRPYTRILSAEPTSNASAPFALIMQNKVTQDMEQHEYDVIICATGYRRTSWVNLLKTSDLAKHFGLSERHSPLDVKLVAADNASTAPPKSTLFMSNENSSAPSSNSDSSSSTPFTSPGPSMFSSIRIDTDPAPSAELHISRNYRLLPLATVEGDESALTSRIYLQGVEEATHGLSDTLLSVLGVRAGEVVSDMYN